ncbi:pyruvate ferredoxin oxidoreductase [candidate division KSB1 bacterium]|nr:MAG: pyruvate ferredoxin oxidoreductase [candidate division KSB1 bacterium]
MSTIIGLTGNEAVAEAMRQINPDVVAAYPITPQTELMHKFADFVANGKVDTEMILVESEHSAMSASVGAAAGGARAMTATCANGLALMWEIVYIAASLRLPIVMAVVNRALSGPINIHNDHSDSMGCRDSGWIQIYSENSQEAYDNTIMAVKIAENKDVLLPVMVTLDGFILSHTLERIEILDDKQVREFIGEYIPQNHLLDINHPVTIGPLDLQDYYFEHKRQEAEAINNALEVVEEVSFEYSRLTGRNYDVLELYRMEDAERAIVALGSTAGTVKFTVDSLRENGEKVGMIKLRLFRPFPYKEIYEALKNVKSFAVLDKCISFGYGGPVYGEIKSALYNYQAFIPAVNYIYGLGGRDIKPTSIKKVFDELKHITKEGVNGKLIHYLDVRE